MAVVVVTDRSFHGDRLFGNLHDLANLVFRNFHLLGQDAGVGLKAKLLQVLTRNAVHLVDRLDHVNWNSDGASLIGNRARNGLANPPCGISGELITTAVFKLVHSLHQTDVAFLNQIKEL